jgi:hypothetical protein
LKKIRFQKYLKLKSLNLRKSDFKNIKFRKTLKFEKEKQKTEEERIEKKTKTQRYEPKPENLEKPKRKDLEVSRNRKNQNAMPAHLANVRSQEVCVGRLMCARRVSWSHGAWKFIS